jgi:hypothetical protein
LLEIVEATARSLSLCMAAMFAVAVLHKARTLVMGQAGAEPVIAALGLGGGAAVAAVVGAAALESGVIATLVFAPPAGCAGTAVLLGVYGLALRGLDPDEGCGCFGSTLDAKRGNAIRRNLVVGLTALTLAVTYLTEALAVAEISQLSLGILLIMASVGAPVLLQRQVATGGEAVG